MQVAKSCNWQASNLSCLFASYCVACACIMMSGLFLARVCDDAGVFPA